MSERVLGLSWKGGRITISRRWVPCRAYCVRSIASSIRQTRIAIRRPVPTAVSVICELAYEVVVVKEEHLRKAVSMLERELGLTIEPAGAAGMAALLANPL